ncbi:MAG: S8 family serine peptidase [Candidatus Aenigmatarchaeota archaeon]
MRFKLICTVVLIIFFTFTESFSFNGKVTGRLQTEIQQKELANKGLLSIQEFEHVVMKSPVPTQFQRVFIHFVEKPDGAKIAELESMGVVLYEDSWVPPIEGHPTGFMIADIPIDRIADIANLNYVHLLNTAEARFKPLNNVGATVIKANNLWSKGYSGYGSTVAILDSGLEYTNSSNKHGDLPDNIIKIDYSNWPSTDTDVRNMVTGHGTHVTGTVLGRGFLSVSNIGNNGGPYKGMAYHSKLVFIKIGDDTFATASTSATVNALKDAAEIYGANVINMSYGGWDNYNDGSEEDEQAADYAYTLGSAVFISAGNSADDDLHYSGTVNGSGSTGCIQINLTNHTGSSYLYVNLVWYDGYPLSKDLYLRFYSDSSCTAEVSRTEYTQTQSSRGTESQWYRHPSSGSYFSGTETTRYIKVFNNATSSQFFHLYLEPVNVDATFQNPDPNYTVGAPSTADHAMSVASYVSRACWTDYMGKSWKYSSLSDCFSTGIMSGFSSRGPRVNGGVQKPNITAPGQGVISLRDHDIATSDWRIIDNDGYNLNGSGPADYSIMSGTSMASPMAAGAAALLMDAYPYLKGNPQVLYNILQSTGSDVESGMNGDGYGLIDINAAYSILVENVYRGDFNGDGRADILTVNPSGGAVLRLSKVDGGGNWNGWDNKWATWPSNYSDVYVGDFNGDGKDDILTVDPNGNAVLRQSAGGAGTWTGWQNFWATWPSSYSRVYVGDFNGDGKDDIFTINPWTGAAVIRQSVVSGSDWNGWSNKWAALPSNYTELYVGDFNGDGRDDLLTRDPLTGYVVIRQSVVSGGNWTGWSNKWASWPKTYSRLSVGDFNGDGKDDVLTLSFSTGGAVLRLSIVSNGDWNGWGNKWAAWPLGSYSKVYVKDFNGDGKDDILTVNPSNGNAVIRQSAGGAGTWTGWSNYWAAWPSVYALIYPARYNTGSTADILTVNPVGGAVLRQSIVTGGNWSGWMNIWAGW